jgi:hypothetical protein
MGNVLKVMTISGNEYLIDLIAISSDGNGNLSKS